MRYMIPKNVNNRFEFFPGFGFNELFITLGGFIIGGILFSIIGLLLGKVLPGTIILVLTTSGAFVICKPNPRTNQSLLQFIIAFKSYKKKQKRYFYRFGTGRVYIDR